MPTLRVMTGGGAPKPPELHFEVQREIGGRGIVHGYGMTESPMIANGSPHDTDEQLANDCKGMQTRVRVVDIADEYHPKVMSEFPVPEGDFCSRGGRFGPHNQHMPTGDPNVFTSDEVCFLTYFCAGLRVFDIRDDHRVDEIAYLIPRPPEHRYGPKPTRLVTQVEDVLVDARGYIYFTEKNSGLYISRWEGPG